MSRLLFNTSTNTNNRGVQNAKRTAGKRNQLPLSSALATSSTLMVIRIQGQLECHSLQTSRGKCQTCLECQTSTRCHHTSCRCLSGTIWKWWEITQVMARNTHNIPQWLQRGAIAHIHKAPNHVFQILALAASKSATAHWSTEPWTCHHHHLHQVVCSGHTCLDIKIVKVATTDITRNWVSFHHSKIVRRSGETMTAIWMIKMSTEVHQDPSISSHQAKSKILISLGILIIITNLTINKLLPRQLRSRMLELLPSKTTETNAIACCIRVHTTTARPRIFTCQHPPSVVSSSRLSWTWVLNNKTILRDNPNTQ